VFVAVGDAPAKIVGYYSLSDASFEKDELPSSWRSGCRIIPCRPPCSDVSPLIASNKGAAW